MHEEISGMSEGASPFHTHGIDFEYGVKVCNTLEKSILFQFKFPMVWDILILFSTMVNHLQKKPCSSSKLYTSFSAVTSLS